MALGTLAPARRLESLDGDFIGQKPGRAGGSLCHIHSFPICSWFIQNDDPGKRGTLIYEEMRSRQWRTESWNRKQEWFTWGKFSSPFSSRAGECGEIWRRAVTPLLWKKAWCEICNPLPLWLIQHPASDSQVSPSPQTLWLLEISVLMS